MLIVTSKLPKGAKNSRPTYSSKCQPSGSNSAIFGYHCAIENSTPSLELRPERRICSGTCAFQTISKVEVCPSAIGFANVTSKIVPSTLYETALPSCLREVTF